MARHIILAFLFVAMATQGYSETYTLNLTTNAPGTESITTLPSGPTYPAGTKVYLKPNTGALNMFAGWSGDLTGMHKRASIFMDGNKMLSARFNTFADGESPAVETSVTDVYVPGSEAKAFKAYGNTNPLASPDRKKWGEVVVRFDELPEAGMSFNLPGMP